MNPESVVIISAAIAAGLALIGVLISGVLQSRSSTFATMVRAYEAMSKQLVDERAESARKDTRLADAYRQIDELNRQLADCYGNRRRLDAAA